jgi:hypothetical protein
MVQLDRAQRLVLAELVAGRDFNGLGPIVVPLLLYKFVDVFHKLSRNKLEYITISAAAE